MHEWALAEAIISAVTDTAEKERLKEIREVKIRVGELQQIELKILRFALSQLKSSRFKKTRFVVKTTEARLKCRICRKMWFFKKEAYDESTTEAIHFVPEVAHTYVRCPECGSPDFEVLEGRGIWLESIRGTR